MKAVSAAITEACKEKDRAGQKKRNQKRPVRAMVAGIPNVGKSTLLTLLQEKHVPRLEINREYEGKTVDPSE